MLRLFAVYELLKATLAFQQHWTGAESAKRSFNCVGLCGPDALLSNEFVIIIFFSLSTITRQISMMLMAVGRGQPGLSSLFGQVKGEILLLQSCCTALKAAN